jgi:hypothetical protein
VQELSFGSKEMKQNVPVASAKSFDKESLMVGKRD